MKVAILGAGVTGLACALECERLGVYADLYERDHTVGWVWPSVNYWPSIFFRDTGDIIDYLKKEYKMDLNPIGECKNIVLKSPNQTASIDGKLGYFIARGKGEESIESQLRRFLRKTVVHFNSNVDYKELSKNYDWVVVTTGNDIVARDLGIWEDEGLVRIMGGVALGDFNQESASLYLDTSYTGSGYARLTPFSSTQAIVGLYTIGCDEFDSERLYSAFLQKEGLTNLEFLYKLLPPPFSTGKVRKFQVRNILLAGRAAGLTERLLGVGAPEGIISGILAARAIINNEDYTKQVEKVRNHVENISSFRKIIEKFDNNDYDKLIAALDTPGIKQIIYNTNIDFADMAGRIIKHVTK
ncbi:MAG TPA: dehydrogenase [Clostridia bacterium]|nr:dehydrogenase [Clostridia bacterium]